jgi:hypothetical protein
MVYTSRGGKAQPVLPSLYVAGRAAYHPRSGLCLFSGYRPVALRPLPVEIQSDIDPGASMKRYVLGAMAVAFLLAGPVGCGKKEIEELKTHVIQLEQQLTDKDKELTELRTKSADAQAQLEATTAQLVQVKTERDKLKKEVTALKKKRAR